MSKMVSEVYEAFCVIGMPENTARDAAEALYAEDDAIREDVRDIKKDLSLIKWMLGFNLALTMALLWSHLELLSRVFQGFSG